MADDTNTAEREAFEAHYRRCGAIDETLSRWVDDGSTPPAMVGKYIIRSVQDAWHAFQAGRASLAASAGSEPVAADGWLHENGLLYRLTDERHPCNRDEINMTMADGSRSIESRSRRALELLDRIRATHHSHPEGMAGWKPIETAPKDGTEILLRSARGRVADGAWGQPDGWANPNCWVWPYINQEPTHWMPLPASEAKEL